jgi:hypothetical protein
MSVSKANLSDPYFKQLLLDIEKTGLLRDDLKYGVICRLNPRFYDATEDLKKRNGQIFDQIKRRTESAYIKLLDKFCVPVGPALQRALRKKDKPASLSKKPVASDSSSSASSSSSSVSSSDQSVANTTERFKKIDISIPTKEIEQIVTSSIEQTPPTSILKKKRIMFSPNSIESVTSNPMADDYDWGPDPALDAALDFRRQTGTKSRPRIVLADPANAEHNFPFDIAPIENVEHNNYGHNGFHIMLPVAMPDMHRWEGFIPSKNEFPYLVPLTGRVVIFKGPSRNFWTRDASRYHHANKGKVNCQITKTQHEKTDTAIKGDPNRQTSYFVIVFHKSFVLDNHIFSGQDSILKLFKNGMKLAQDDPEYPFKKEKKADVLGLVLWWRIGTAGGIKIRNGKVGDTADDYFD